MSSLNSAHLAAIHRDEILQILQKGPMYMKDLKASLRTLKGEDALGDNVPAFDLSFCLTTDAMLRDGSVRMNREAQLVIPET